MTAAVWAAACIVVGATLIICAIRPTPWTRRPAAATALDVAGDLGDDFPTVELFRRDELLWHKGAEDGEGTITLGLLPEEGGQLGVLMDLDGEAAGVRLDRHEVQGLRDSLTNHLVATSTQVPR